MQVEGSKKLGRSPINQRLSLEDIEPIDWSLVDSSKVIENLEIKVVGNLQK